MATTIIIVSIEHFNLLGNKMTNKTSKKCKSVVFNIFFIHSIFKFMFAHNFCVNSTRF